MEVYKGKWIWNSSADKKNAYVNFIREFEINEVSKGAQLFISADTEYVVWINESFVSCGQYRDFPKHMRYDTLDIERYLKKGKNRMLIKVYYQGEESLQYAQGEAGLWFMLLNGETCIESDKNVLTSIAEEYKSGEIFKTTDQLAYGFICDARREDYDKMESAIEVCEKEFYKRPVKKAGAV